jgi:hypothetical protein
MSNETRINIRDFSFSGAGIERVINAYARGISGSALGQGMLAKSELVKGG